MTLPVSGAISFNAINVELGVAGTTTANINQASYRTLAGVPSGTISLSNFYGKSNAFVFSPTISSNTLNYDLRAAAVAAGWNQTIALKATVTVNSGVYVGSSTTGGIAFTWTGSYPSGSTLAIVNNGTIEGAGGAGGNGQQYAPGSNGNPGGTALQGNYAISITNNSNVAGGGGGGTGGYFTAPKGSGVGGGGGGGAGYNVGAGGTGTNPGSPGTITGTGGAGGTPGSNRIGGTAGGNWGVAGTNNPFGATGGAAGKATATGTNAFITWVATGNRYGALS